MHFLRLAEYGCDELFIAILACALVVQIAKQAGIQHSPIAIPIAAAAGIAVAVNEEYPPDVVTGHDLLCGRHLAKVIPFPLPGTGESVR